MTNYIGITLGPIYATLQHARNTREIWAASYLFSRLTELLLEALPSIGAEVLVPFKVDTPISQRYGTGIYNDRIFAVLPEGGVTKIAGLVEAVINKLAVELTPKKSNPNPDFWRRYLRIGVVTKEIESLNNGALFSEISPLLDTQELYTPYFQNAEEADTLTVLLEGIYDTALAKNALQDAKGTLKGLMHGLFPSTADLGTLELYRRNEAAYKDIQEKAKKSQNENEQLDEFYQQIMSEPAFKDNFRDYHKYFCIVHADGDNLSEQNRKLSDKKAYEKLSQQLSQFALDAAQLVDDFGGKTVFAGGDDLLFFAPVCTYNSTNKSTDSIFSLIQDLDNRYNQLGFANTSLSFGITITYHKYPLFEARQLSYEELNEIAKKVHWKDGGEKNAIAVRMLKHSGAWFESVLSKKNLESFVKAESELRRSKDDLLSGIIYKMDALESLITQLLHDTAFEERLAALFTNYFNEPVHRRNKVQLELIRNFVAGIITTKYKLNDTDPQGNNVYTLLRMLQFVTSRPKSSSSQATNHYATANNDL